MCWHLNLSAQNLLSSRNGLNFTTDEKMIQGLQLNAHLDIGQTEVTESEKDIDD